MIFKRLVFGFLSVLSLSAAITVNGDELLPITEAISLPPSAGLSILEKANDPVTGSDGSDPDQVSISGTGLLPPITTPRMVDNGYSLMPKLDSTVASNLDNIWAKGAIEAYEEAPDVDDYH